MSQVFTVNNAIQVLIETPDFTAQLNGAARYIPEQTAIVAQNVIPSNKNLSKVLGRITLTGTTTHANSQQIYIAVRLYQAAVHLSVGVLRKINIFRRPIIEALRPSQNKAVRTAKKASQSQSPVLRKKPIIFQKATQAFSAAIHRVAHLVRHAGTTTIPAVRKTAHLILKTLPEFVHVRVQKHATRVYTVAQSSSAVARKHAIAFYHATQTTSAAVHKKAVALFRVSQHFVASKVRHVTINTKGIVRQKTKSVQKAIYAAANFFNIPSIWVVTETGFTKVVRQIFVRQSDKVVITTANTSNVVLETSNTSSVVITPEYPK